MTPDRDSTPAAPDQGAAGRHFPTRRPADQQHGFDAFVAVHWPTLVRAALALGAPPGLAPEVAADAVTRLHRTWRRLDSEGDPVREALSLLVEAWDDHRRTPWWRVHEAGPGLASLDAPPRARRAEQVVGVLGDGVVPSGDDGWARIRSAPVGRPPTVAELAAAERARRTRAARRLAPRVGAALIAVALVGGLAWGLTRPPAVDPAALPDVAVRTGEESWLTWWADGALHLAGTVIDLPDVQQVVPTRGRAAVYADSAGLVVRVGSDGSRHVVGHTPAATSLVGSADGGLVTWADDTTPGVPAVVVATATSLARSGDVEHPGRGEGRRSLDLTEPERADLRPVAVTGTVVWLAGAAGTSVWRLDDDAADPVDPVDLDGLVDLAGTHAVVLDASGVLAVRDVTADGTVSPAAARPLVGRDVTLSPDGRLAVSLAGDGVPHVVDLTTGRVLPSGVPSELVALTAAADTDGRIAYVVGRAADRPQAGEYVRSSFTGSISVITCQIPAAAPTADVIILCESVASTSGTAGSPLLTR